MYSGAHTYIQTIIYTNTHMLKSICVHVLESMQAAVSLPQPQKMLTMRSPKHIYRYIKTQTMTDCLSPQWRSAVKPASITTTRKTVQSYFIVRAWIKKGFSMLCQQKKWLFTDIVLVVSQKHFHMHSWCAQWRKIPRPFKRIMKDFRL